MQRQYSNVTVSLKLLNIKKKKLSVAPFLQPIQMEAEQANILTCTDSLTHVLVHIHIHIHTHTYIRHIDWEHTVGLGTMDRQRELPILMARESRKDVALNLPKCCESLSVVLKFNMCSTSDNTACNGPMRPALVRADLLLSTFMSLKLIYMLDNNFLIA